MAFSLYTLSLNNHTRVDGHIIAVLLCVVHDSSIIFIKEIVMDSYSLSYVREVVREVIIHLCISFIHLVLLTDDNAPLILKGIFCCTKSTLREPSVLTFENVTHNSFPGGFVPSAYVCAPVWTPP